MSLRLYSIVCWMAGFAALFFIIFGTLVQDRGLSVILYGVAFLLLSVTVIGSFFHCRCPNCNRYLGQGLAIKKCPRCSGTLD